MSTAIEIASDIHTLTSNWSKGQHKLVMALDGYTGVGKTTILNELLKLNPDILPVHVDDFILPPAEFKEILAENSDRSIAFELHRNDYARIEELVNRFRTQDDPVEVLVANPVTGAIDVPKTFDCSKKIMVVEGVFMFHPKLLNHLWDKRIYLDGDTTKIDERRIAREKARWGDKYFPETHPDSFFGQVVIALKRYREEYKPEELADAVLFVN